MKTKFLVIILNNNKMSTIDSTVLIRNWLKYSVQSTASTNAHLLDLTKIVVTLGEFRELCDFDSNALLAAKEPICLFIAAIGKKYSNAMVIIVSNICIVNLMNIIIFFRILVRNSGLQINYKTICFLLKNGLQIPC